MDEAEKQKKSVLLLAGLVVLLAVVGVVSWKSVSASASAPEVIVKPANPSDPKYHPDPKLGLAGGNN